MVVLRGEGVLMIEVSLPCREGGGGAEGRHGPDQTDIRVGIGALFLGVVASF